MFQSVIISGGYSTGRELIEFFMSAGPLGGLCGMLLTMSIWSLILALTFEFARIHRAYDYRRFFRRLLGRAWVVFELSYLAVAVLALAVIGAAAGVIFADMTGAPKHTGTILMMCAIGVLAFYGTALIEKMISLWSFVLYGTYVTLFVIAVRTLGDDVALTLNNHAQVVPDWLDALEYAGINIAAVPAILFGVAHITTRRQSFWAGGLAGPIAMIPALLFYVVLLSQYPQVLAEEVPLISLLAALHTPLLAMVFKVVIFGTYIETGVALVHSINERIAGFKGERGGDFSHRQRVISAVVLMVFSIYLAASFGLVNLISKGFGTLTYVILAVYVLPLLTVGLMQIVRFNTPPANSKGPA